MTEYTVKLDGVEFTIHSGSEAPAPYTTAEWEENIRTGWARGKQNFIVLNTLAPIGAEIEVKVAEGSIMRFARAQDDESPIMGWERVDDGPGPMIFAGDVGLAERGTHWRPWGTAIWYPFIAPLGEVK